MFNFMFDEIVQKTNQNITEKRLNHDNRHSIDLKNRIDLIFNYDSLKIDLDFWYTSDFPLKPDLASDRHRLRANIAKCQILKFCLPDINPHAPDRFTPSRARCAEKCGSALNHR